VSQDDQDDHVDIDMGHRDCAACQRGRTRVDRRTELLATMAATIAAGLPYPSGLNDHEIASWSIGIARRIIELAETP
jgi:hypothetical protein